MSVAEMAKSILKFAKIKQNKMLDGCTFYKSGTSKKYDGRNRNRKIWTRES